MKKRRKEEKEGRKSIEKELVLPRRFSCQVQFQELTPYPIALRPIAPRAVRPVLGAAEEICALEAKTKSGVAILVCFYFILDVWFVLLERRWGFELDSSFRDGLC